MEEIIRRKDDFEGQRMIVLPEKILKSLVNNDITNNLHATDIGYFPAATGHYRRRENGSMQNILIYCVNGSGWVSMNGKRSEIRKDQYCIIPSGTPHTYAAGVRDPWTIYWVHFSGNLAGKILQGSVTPVNSSLLTDAGKEARFRLFDEVFSNLSAEYTIQHLEYASMALLHFIGSFSHEQSFSRMSEPRYEDITSKAIEYMKSHLSSKVSISEIADHCGISVSHFCLMFKRRTSHPPVEFMNQLRIQQACQLLDLTAMKISEIAERLGFTDPFYFSRVFKKTIGQSPKDYRRNKSG